MNEYRARVGFEFINVRFHETAINISLDSGRHRSPQLIVRAGITALAIALKIFT